MKKSEGMTLLEQELNRKPELKKQLESEAAQIAEADKNLSKGETLVKAAAVLGYTVTSAEMDRFCAEVEELKAEELEKVSGGVGRSEEEMLTLELLRGSDCGIHVNKKKKSF